MLNISEISVLQIIGFVVNRWFFFNKYTSTFVTEFYYVITWRLDTEPLSALLALWGIYHTRMDFFNKVSVIGIVYDFFVVGLNKRLYKRISDDFIRLYADAA